MGYYKWRFLRSAIFIFPLNKPTELFGVNHDEDVYKPMDVFGWDRHYEKIRDVWLERVGNRIRY